MKIQIGADIQQTLIRGDIMQDSIKDLMQRYSDVIGWKAVYTPASYYDLPRKHIDMAHSGFISRVKGKAIVRNVNIAGMQDTVRVLSVRLEEAGVPVDLVDVREILRVFGFSTDYICVSKETLKMKITYKTSYIIFQGAYLKTEYGVHTWKVYSVEHSKNLENVKIDMLLYAFFDWIFIPNDDTLANIWAVKRQIEGYSSCWDRFLKKFHRYCRSG
jgi:hypothetical protein